MPLHDFECEKCGHQERNLVFKVADLPKVRECEKCGEVASVQIFDQYGKGQIDINNPVLYGHWHPQAGEVIRDYAHKQELMKKYGWIEGSDPVGGNRKLSEEVSGDESQPEPGDEGADWMDYDDVKKLTKQESDVPLSGGRAQ
tara:strand:- start:2697 stop:3125 length:429 start_codon:yes stop_codon:yes gene_type:complete